MNISTKQVLVAVIASALALSCDAFSPSSSTRQVSSRIVQPSLNTPSVAPRLVESSALSAFGSSSKQDEVDFVPSVDQGVLSSVIEPLTDVFILTLRVGTCALMIHHGFDKIQNVDGFSANVVAKFFGFLPGPASFWTLSAAGTQIVGSALLTVGVLARPVAFSMMMTMAVAVIFHLLNTGAEGFPLAVVSQHSYNFELAAMYVGVLAYFATSGAGAYSVDEQLLGGELQFYDSLLGKVFNNSDDEEV